MREGVRHKETLGKRRSGNEQGEDYIPTMGCQPGKETAVGQSLDLNEEGGRGERGGLDEGQRRRREVVNSILLLRLCGERAGVTLG